MFLYQLILTAVKKEILECESNLKKNEQKIFTNLLKFYNKKFLGFFS